MQPLQGVMALSFRQRSWSATRERTALRIYAPQPPRTLYLELPESNLSINCFHPRYCCF